MLIQVEIQSCRQCPNFKITGSSSTDGFDRGDDWQCTKADRPIALFVEWHERPAIPEWCPVKSKSQTPKQ